MAGAVASNSIHRARSGLLDSRFGGNDRSSIAADVPKLNSSPSSAMLHDFPYTGTMAPRVTALSGEARNTIVAATSSTLGQAA